MSSDDEDIECLSDSPEEVSESFKSTQPHALQTKTLSKYNNVYNHFHKWNQSNGGAPVSDDILIKFFSEVSEKSKPSSLWAYYSMLKITFKSKDNLDITKWTKLTDYLKSKSVGFKSLRPKTFKIEDIRKFIDEADDEYWLDAKVYCIFALLGAYSTKLLTTIKVEHLKQYDDLILVTIPKTETSPMCTFSITGSFVQIVRKFEALRPKNVVTKRFFLRYHGGRCTTQHVGKNKFAQMPRKVAKYLKLPEPQRYSAGASFRKISFNFTPNTNKWNTSIVNEQQQETQYSLDHETGLLKTANVTSHTSPPVSAVSNKSDNLNGNGNEHVCTISCGHVKCAMEENEESVLHSFEIMKPSGYVIQDITPAAFPSDPTCRWIVAYTDITEHVSTFNADKTFNNITRSTPNNVRVVQKYIRGKSSQMSAAYVVVYGVNCRCQGDVLNAFDFSLNGIKCEV